MSHYEGGRGEQSSPLPIRANIAAVSRHKWLIATVVAITVGSALALTFRQPTTYTSEVKLNVEPITYSLDPNDDQDVNMATELEWATSERVASMAAQELGGGVPASALLKAEIDNPEGTEILVFSFTSAKPNAPQERVTALANAYLQFRRDRAIEEMTALTNALRDRSKVIETQLKEVNERLAATPEAERSSLQVESDAYSGQLALLRQQLATLSSPEFLRVGTIIEEAGVPKASVPSPITTGILAAIVGVALGIGLALLRDHLNERPQSNVEFELYSGAPVLGALPTVRSWRRGKDPFLVSKLEPASASSEAYRALRTSVLFAAAQRPFGTVLVTSANPEEGKTAVTANLAATLAEAGKRVIVVGGDLRRPRVHEFFRVHNGFGLTSVLDGKASLNDALAGERYPGLRVLPAGHAVSNPVELLSSPRMKETLDSLSSQADFVLIDGTPLLPVADAHVLVPFIDAVLFVVDAQNTSRTAIERARTRLEQLDAPVIGMVANRFEQASRLDGYGQYYSYPRDRRHPDGIKEGDEAPNVQ